MVSYFTLFLCKSHSMVPDQNIPVEFPDVFEKYIEGICDSWIKCHELYIKMAKEQKIAMHFLRYEDLVTQPRETLTSLLEFLFKAESLEGTNLQRRMDDVLSQDPRALQVYALKDGGKVRMNKSMHLIQKKQLDLFKQKAKNCLHFFDYAEREGNTTGFYNLEDSSDASPSDLTDNFRTCNEQA